MPVVLLLLSCVILTLEVLETKIFAYSLANTMIFVVVGIVLLGFGAGGTALSLKRKLGDPRRIVRGNLWAMAVMLVVAHAYFAQVSDRLQFNLDFVTLSTLLLLSAPYFHAGKAIAAILADPTGNVHRRYGINLLGSALGCITVFWLLGPLTAPQLLMICAGLCMVMAASQHVRRLRWTAVAIVTGTVLCWQADRILPYKIEPLPGQLAALEFNMARVVEEIPTVSEARLVGRFDRWDPTARVQAHAIEVETSDANLRADLDHLPCMWFTQDSSYGSPLLGQARSPEGLADFAERTAYGAGYFRGRPDEDVLLIGLGGAPDVQVALHSGASSVVGVDINAAALDMVRELGDYLAHPYEDPRVELRVQDGRSFVRSDSRQYDHIQLSGVDTKSLFAAGTLAINESYLYTAEAFEEYLERLKPEGLLCIGYAGEDFMHRMAISAMAALEEAGAESPHEHLMLVGQSGIFVLIVKPTPFLDEECEQMEAWLQSADRGDGNTGVYLSGFELLAGPALSLMPLPHAIYLPGRPTDDAIMQAAVAGNLPEVMASQPVDLTPVPDRRPFFFHTQRLEDVWTQPLPHFRQLFVLVGIMGVLSLVLILGPLLVLQRRGLQVRRNAPFAVYFACLGAGFILAEIGLIQRYVLFLGHQGYAFPAVIGGLLVAAGLGSLWAGKLKAVPHKVIPWAAASICAAIGLQHFLLDDLFDLTAGAPLLLRGTVSVLALLPLGVPLGMMFPTGLDLVRRGSPLFVPWALGINGALSVVGTTLSMPGAILYGFPAMAAAAAGLYVLAALIGVPLSLRTGFPSPGRAPAA